MIDEMSEAGFRKKRNRERENRRSAEEDNQNLYLDADPDRMEKRPVSSGLIAFTILPCKEGRQKRMRTDWKRWLKLMRNPVRIVILTPKGVRQDDNVIEAG